MSDEPDDGAVEPERETPAWLSRLGDERWVDQTFEEMTARQEFIDKVSCGTSEFNAGIEVGWTPAKIRTMTADPDFRELVPSPANSPTATSKARSTGWPASRATWPRFRCGCSTVYRVVGRT